MKKFYITTPIYYVNDVPHLGHAYTSIIADVLARFKRLDGYDVKFLTGTDEHGQKVEKAASSKGMTPQEMVDKNYVSFKELTPLLNLSNDDFIRTSEERHKVFVADIWQKMIANGSLYLGTYAGWYAVRDEAFYAESELINGKAPSGAEVEWIEEPSYFFKLSAFEQKLLDYYTNNPGFIFPESRRNEVISFVKSGLNDLSVSRTSFTWGIKVPGDEKHIIYVWLDALFNYISALGSVSNKFWPCDLHILGKDILRFHAIYWPAFLMALDIELPQRVYAHGWWTVNGEKMSKSLGNVLSPKDLIAEYGLDFMRYYVVRELPLGSDGNFSKETITARSNSELANNIGNLTQRVLSFINKNCRGVVPSNSNLQNIDKELIEAAYSVIVNMREDIDKQALNNAYEHVVRLGSRANEYIDHQAPWKLQKNDPIRMEAVLYSLVEVIRCLAIMLQPIIPDSAQRMLSLLNLSDCNFAQLNADYALTPGAPLPEPEVIFSRLM